MLGMLGTNTSSCLYSLVAVSVVPPTPFGIPLTPGGSEVDLTANLLSSSHCWENTGRTDTVSVAEALLPPEVVVGVLGLVRSTVVGTLAGALKLGSDPPAPLDTSCARLAQAKDQAGM